MMKRTLILLALALCIISCQNQENEFPDFDYTTGYFPYQYPVRILVLGNYIYDNTNDNNHRFVISTVMGGAYENKTERIFNFVVDETLCNDAYFDKNGKDIIRPLPTSYYTLSDPSKIVIPAGQMRGGIEVQLTETFFNDPQAIKNTYVLPIRITSALNIDSLLQGTSTNPYADRRIDGHWKPGFLPKDFTMFAVKFVNPYHGSYLMRGKASVKENGTALGDSIYQSASGYIEHDLSLFMKTESRTSVRVASTPFKSKALSGSYELILNFASDKYDTDGGVVCTVEAVPGAAYTVSGTGKYTIGAAEFGGKKRDVIEITYTIKTNNKEYTATDRFVFRDKGVNLETFKPTIIPEV